MKLILIIALVFPMFTYAQNWKDLKKVAKKVNKELNNTSKQVNSFSESEAAAALKETLNRGVEKGVDVLSLKGGFYNNLNVKIPFPPEANTVYNKVKKMGMQKELDKAVLSMNRAAEDAVITAKPIFVKTIKNMNIKDAINIVKGTNNAGTDYLYENTNSDLIEAFKPNIKSSLDKVDATKHWKRL